MGGIVISFHDKKAKKEIKLKEEELVDSIYDFYIPYSEVPFWSNVSQCFPQKNITWFTDDKMNQEVTEFFSAFTTDIEMYQEFGVTLEKFRFLFSYFELFILLRVLSDMKNSNSIDSEELNHYLVFLEDQLQKNKPLLQHMQHVLKK